jgi:hypothetical protein
MERPVNPHYYSLHVCNMVPSSITGPDAKNAIADWQTAHGLVADGVIGPATADAMHLDALAKGGYVLHFSNAEILQGLALPEGWEPRLRRLLRFAEVRRQDVFGGVPCEILAGGGFRDAAKPRVAGQAKKSLHYEMMALDMRPTALGAGVPVADWRARTLAMMQDGRLTHGGFNTYTDHAKPFQHADFRGSIVNGW